MLESSQTRAITILASYNNRACAKIIERLHDGEIRITPYDKEYLWVPRVEEVSTLDQMLGVLQAVESSEIVVNGALLNERPTEPIPRRLYDPDATIKAVPRQWVAIDFDDVDVPEGKLRARLSAARRLLPEAFHTAGCVWQLTSSYGLKGTGLRCRFWFLLDEPVLPTAWKYLLGGIKGVDTSIYTCNQPVYVCPPTIIGMADPAPVRFGKAPGSEEVVVANLPLAGALSQAKLAASAGKFARCDVVPNERQIADAIEKILGQEPTGARHEWMVGAACELYALGTDPQRIVDTCEECLRLHGREPDPGEAVRAVRFAANKQAQGLLRTTNVALSTLLPDDIEDDGVLSEPDPDLVEALPNKLSKDRAHVSNAEIFVRATYGEWGYLRIDEQDYVTDGPAWRRMSIEEMDGDLTRMGRNLSASLVTSVAKACRRFYHRAGVEAPCWLDAENRPTNAPGASETLVLGNGTVRIEDALMCPATALRPHTTRLFTTTVLPFDYDPAAACPVLMRCLGEWFPGDPAIQRELQKMFGYMVSGNNSLQKMFVFVGKSRAGKGLLTTTLTNLLGTANCAAHSLASFGGPHGLEELPGKSALFINEANAQRAKDVSQETVDRLKSISGNDGVTINPKHRALRSVVLGCRIVMSCNRPPRLEDDSHALTNRMVVFPFGRSFAGQEDETLTARLAGELPGIFNWALEGAAMLLEDGGFTVSDTARDFLADVRNVTAPLSAFIQECLEPRPDGVCFSSAIYNCYKAWATEQGISRMAPRMDVLRRVKEEYSHIQVGDLGRKQSLLGVVLSKAGRSYANIDDAAWDAVTDTQE